MANKLIKSILIALIVCSNSASASIISYSQNPDLPTGAVAAGAFYTGIAAYNPSNPTASPTPYNNSASNPPVARNYFTAGEVVSIAQMVDLQALNQSDDNTAWLGNDPNQFQWSAFWYNTLALPATPVNANFFDVSWSDISVLQASTLPVYEALTFWANDAYIPAAGTWIVDTYFEGNYSNSIIFDVPEPSTIFLLSLGVLGVVTGKRKAVKVAT